MMDRRAFLARFGFGTAAAAAAALTFDVEKLLWVAGEKTIFVPPPPPPVLTTAVGMTRGDIFTIDGVFALHPITQKPLAFLKQFVITEDVHAGIVDLELSIFPRPIAKGPYANCTDIGRGRKAKPMLVGTNIPMTFEWADIN